MLLEEKNMEDELYKKQGSFLKTRFTFFLKSYWKAVWFWIRHEFTLTKMGSLLGCQNVIQNLSKALLEAFLASFDQVVQVDAN